MSKRGDPYNTDDDAERPGNYGNLRKKGRHESLADLKSLVNDPERSDVILGCSDGKQVHACRVLLAKRCAVFDRMFNNGMMESSLPEIRLESFPSRIILAVVEFLYTGTIDTFPIQDWKMGFELMKAAQFFMIPTLELMAQEYLKSEASKACLNGEQNVLMRMLSISLEFHENWAEKEAMLTELTVRIHEDWFGLCSTCELSRYAVDYILNNSRVALDYEDENWPRMEEYCVLRNIVLWHIQHATEDEKTDKVRNEIFPPRESLWTEPVEMTDIKCFLSEYPISMDSYDPTAVLNSVVGVKIFKESMEQMLQQYVKLSCIPASLTWVLIRPLKVFPPQELVGALLHVGLSRRVHRSVFKSDWWRTPGSTIRIHSNGYILWDTDSMIRADMAVANVPAHENCEYGWSFEIRETDATLIDVGFICVPRGNYELVNDIVKANIEDFNVEDFSEIRFLRINTEEKKVSLPIRTDPGNWEHFETTAEEVFKVDFHFNTAVLTTCEVYVGDSREAYIFSKLSGEQYLPVISLKHLQYGEVQFKLLHGYNFY